MNKIVRVIEASEDEILEVKWRTRDNSTFVKKYEVPPKATREYKREE